MSHLDFTRPSGQYPAECVPGPNDFQDFDAKQTRCVNGDAGGSWTCVTPIIMGGAGWALGSASTCTGGALTTLGGRIKLGSAGNAFPDLSPARPRTISMPILLANLVSGQQDDSVIGVDSSLGVAGVQGINSLTFPIPGKFLHNGATLVSLSLCFRLLSVPTILPLLNGLSFQLLTYGGAPNPTTVAATGWIALHGESLNTYRRPTAAKINGYYYVVTVAGTTAAAEPTWPLIIGNTVVDGTVTWKNVGFNGQIAPSTVPAYYNNHQAQSVAITVDNTFLPFGAIDTTQNVYSIFVTHAGDASATIPSVNMILHSLTMNFSYGGTNGLAFE